MQIRRLLVTSLASVLALVGPGIAPVTRAQDLTPGPPPDPVAAGSPSPTVDVIPARLGYLTGEVSFWRPGATDWAPARVNTPLAPGDVLVTGGSGHIEIQTGPRAFVRAGENSQIGLDSQKRDFLQLHVVSGHVALDLRDGPAGSTIELDTPGAAFTIAQAGYYRVDVASDTVTFAVHRGGGATMTPQDGTGVAIAANQQVVLRSASTPHVETGPAPELTAWDRWNDARTAYLLQPTATAGNAPAGIYGAPELDQYGTWSVVETYGPVWTPRAVPVGWTPYSTGRWIWDPFYGWTWLDDAPWGWAPYHHGRWVFVGHRWVWTPGPRIVRPVYAPALVVFLGPVTVSVGRPVAWAPLGWGEPVIPWWGRRGFVGVPWWGGWGGPRVVNNVVVHNTTVVQQVTTYRNVHVVNGVVGVPADRFGRGRTEVSRFSHDEIERLRPVRGAPSVRPVAASVVPDTGLLRAPAPAAPARPVVTVRPPQDGRPTVRSHPIAPDARGGGRHDVSPSRAATPTRQTVVPQSGVSPEPRPTPVAPVPAPRAPERPSAADRQRPSPPVTRPDAVRPDPSPSGDVARPAPQPVPQRAEAPRERTMPTRPATRAVPQTVPRPSVPQIATPDRRPDAVPSPGPRSEPPRRLEGADRRSGGEHDLRSVGASSDSRGSHGAGGLGPQHGRPASPRDTGR
jgi:hypothetical protein